MPIDHLANTNNGNTVKKVATTTTTLSGRTSSLAIYTVNLSALAKVMGSGLQEVIESMKATDDEDLQLRRVHTGLNGSRKARSERCGCGHCVRRTDPVLPDQHQGLTAGSRRAGRGPGACLAAAFESDAGNCIFKHSLFSLPAGVTRQ